MILRIWPQFPGIGRHLPGIEDKFWTAPKMASLNANLDLPLELQPLAVDLDAELPVVELPLPLATVRRPRVVARGGVSVGAEADSRTIAL